MNKRIVILSTGCIKSYIYNILNTIGIKVKNKNVSRIILENNKEIIFKTLNKKRITDLLKYKNDIIFINNTFGIFKYGNYETIINEIIDRTKGELKFVDTLTLHPFVLPDNFLKAIDAPTEERFKITFENRKILGINYKYPKSIEKKQVYIPVNKKHEAVLCLSDNELAFISEEDANIYFNEKIEESISAIDEEISIIKDGLNDLITIRENVIK